MTPSDPDTMSWVRIAIAFAVVGGLMGLMGVLLKYVGQRGILLPRLTKNAKRLTILESIPLDIRRRLVIVRCDDKEHLLLLGANQDIVIELNLTAPSIAPFRTKTSA